MYIDGDNYEINNNITYGQGCFSNFNYQIRNIDDELKSASIILKKEYLDFFTEEDRTLYLKEIQKISVLPFTTSIKNNELYISFVIDKIIKKHSYLCYSGMLIRCLYQNNNDDFRSIAKHFIQMCKYFPKKDRGLLFTTSCNISIKSKEISNYFNSNHILMFNQGCKILNKLEINKILELNEGINGNFSDFIDFEKYKLDDNSKKSYAKIMKINGIKSTKK